MAALPEMIENLPEGIVTTYILPRLPVKLVGLARCASKMWRSLLSTRRFAKAHLEAHRDGPESLINENGGVRILTVTDTAGERASALFGPVINIPLVETKYNICVVLGICDGLVLFNAISDQIKIVMNPITREAVKLPNCPDRYHVCWPLGLGYDSLADDHKVVSYTRNGDYYVYSLRAKCWRGIGRFHGRGYDGYKSAVFLKDHFHWLDVGDDLRSAALVSFNLVHEEFDQMPVPSGVCDDFHAVGVRVLGGRLFLMHEQNYLNAIDIWVMEEYGVKDSWTKMTTMRFHPEDGPAWGELREPVVRFLECMFFLNENEIVVQIRYYHCHDHLLWAYNWRNGGWREINIVGEDTMSFGTLPATTFKESLVSPNYI